MLLRLLLPVLSGIVHRLQPPVPALQHHPLLHAHQRPPHRHALGLDGLRELVPLQERRRRGTVLDLGQAPGHHHAVVLHLLREGHPLVVHRRELGVHHALQHARGGQLAALLLGGLGLLLLHRGAPLVEALGELPVHHALQHAPHQLLPPPLLLLLRLLLGHGLQPLVEALGDLPVLHLAQAVGHQLPVGLVGGVVLVPHVPHPRQRPVDGPLHDLAHDGLLPLLLPTGCIQLLPGLHFVVEEVVLPVFEGHAQGPVPHVPEALVDELLHPHDLLGVHLPAAQRRVQLHLGHPEDHLVCESPLVVEVRYVERPSLEPQRHAPVPNAQSSATLAARRHLDVHQTAFGCRYGHRCPRESLQGGQWDINVKVFTSPFKAQRGCDRDMKQ